jgi:TPR repeat protein
MLNEKILLLPVISILLFCAPVFADFAKGLDAVQKGDFVTALKEWKPLAEQGNSTVHHNLGWMYSNGHGVTQNYKTAVKYYTLHPSG